MTRPHDNPGQDALRRRPIGSERLRRSGNNRVFAGVIGGIADFLDVGARWLRFFFLVSIPLTGGITLLVYFLLWLLLPGPVQNN